MVLIFLIVPLLASGGYDHGTSTGKGQFEIDLTWNPFDLIDFGQTYAVIGYGITDRLDLHGYFAHQADGRNNYYYGIFYQFIDWKYLDLATAVGLRRYTDSDAVDLFYPQLLFTFKLSKKLDIGGAFVNIKREEGEKYVDKGSAFDIAVYIRLSDELKLPEYIEDVKLGIGLFNPGIFEPEEGEFLPTYSIDIIFKRIGKK